MATRIPWDKYETAILIYACIQVINNKMDRNTAIQTVSAKLDNVYRNYDRFQELLGIEQNEDIDDRGDEEV